MFFLILDTICTGHNEDDLLEFSDFLGKGETYTNKEFMAFIDPANDELPYTYDNYAFSFCDELGYDFLDTSSKGLSSEIGVLPGAAVSGGKSSSSGGSSSAAAAAAAAAQAAAAAAASSASSSSKYSTGTSTTGKFTSSSPRRIEVE